MVLATWQEREEFIAAYEAARTPGSNSDLQDFLPPVDHPLRREVLVELIRIELEQSTQVPRVDSFLARFPELAEDREGVARIAFEEYRQKCLHGEAVCPEDYAARYGIVTTDWPCPAPCDGEGETGPTNVLAPPPVLELDRAARSFRHVLAEHGTVDSATVNDWSASYAGPAEHAFLFRHWHATNPERALEIAEALSTMPQAGQQFAGFELVQELGRGAFGRVFLALQTDLAHRYVVLKISARAPGEPETLARLQHTNVVPIYSVHRKGPLQAVCMPYFGGTTLADIDVRLTSADKIPAHGQFLVDALGKHHKTLATETGTTPMHGGTLPAAAKMGQAELAAGQGHTEATLQMLAGLSYVDAVLWLISRLAEGLAHAHERGIVHSDLKPANILITDEGQPMLLDFNLAVDTTRQVEGRKAFIGGTFPYMAPEHLESFRSNQPHPDLRSDLYSLGVILCRLLTRRHPFPQPGGSMSVILPGMITQRRQVPALRKWNAAISPAVEAIAQHCLQPDPARRYQSARQLQEDIDRHRHNLPLRYAPNPSWVERAAKWKRRHPRLTSATSIVVVVLLLLGGVAAAAWAIVRDLEADVEQRDRQLAVQRALDTWRHFQHDAQAAQFDVLARPGEGDGLKRGLQNCRQTLGRYQVIDNPHWREQPAVTNLDEATRTQLSLQVADLLLLLARGTMMLAPSEAGSASEQTTKEALKHDELAEASYAPDAPPRLVWDMGSKLQASLGKDAEARALAAKAEALPPRPVRDNYWRGADLYFAGRYQQALPLLEEVVRLDPKHLRAWWLIANCHSYASRFADAARACDVCIALDPTQFWPWNNRGLAYGQLKQPAKAVADLDKAIELKHDYVNAYIDRALAQQSLKHYKEAVADLTKALEFQGSPTRVYLMRARVWDLLGDKARAKQDREEGLRREPADELSWNTRGWARLDFDVPAAIADFDKALELNPRSRYALENKAYALSEKLPAKDAAEKQALTEQAIALFDKCVAFHPDLVSVRNDRGVLLARLGKRAEALIDAQEVLKRDTQPRMLYQVACIYALTAKEQPDDRVEAFRLLSMALRQGFGYDLVETDSDLAALRQFPEYHKLVTGVRALRSGK